MNVIPIQSIRPDGSVAFTGDVDFGTNKGINLGTPTANADAATKSYADGLLSSLTAGDALTRTANEFDVNVDGVTLLVNGSDQLEVQDDSHSHTKANISDLETITATPTNGAVPLADGSGVVDAAWLGTTQAPQFGRVGIGAAADGTFQFNLGGTKLHGTATGIGVGTTAPGKAYEINSATGDNFRLTYNDSDGSPTNYADFTLAADGTLTIAANGTDPDLILRTASFANALVIDDSTGYVGIGTAAPGRELHIDGTNPAIRLQDDSDGDTTVCLMEWYGDTDGRHSYIGHGSTGHNDFQIVNDADDGIGLYVSSSTTALYAGSNGAVGIGQGSASSLPTASLDVKASTTALASLRVRSGTAPTSPNDGDIWYDGSNLHIRVGGTAYTLDKTSV